MNAFHCIIQTERRSAPRQLAWDDLGQLRAMGEAFNGDQNVLAAVEWDQVSPYITVHRGAISDFKVWLAGWPMVDIQQYEAQRIDAINPH